MPVFARVVVGVDGTEWGFEALRQTLALAPSEGSSVDAVTALDTRPAVRTGFEAAYWVDVLTEEATAARDMAAKILGDRPGSTARVVRGERLHVLRRVCEEANATLLVLGGRHSSRFLGIMLGDTATELLHDGTCSVLVARPQWGKEWQPRTVVVGLDGSASALAALEAADDIAARLGAAVEGVSATGGEAIRPEGGWADRVDSWDEAHPVDALMERSARADLVIVGSRGLHGLRALGSVSERVAHHARCSVLVVHEGTSARGV
jgi:nucleotide-binding universal stress UspA family protein